MNVKKVLILDESVLWEYLVYANNKCHTILQKFAYLNICVNLGISVCSV